MSARIPLRREKRGRREALSRRCLWALAGAVLMICMAALFPAILTLRSAGPDLFDLTPNIPRVDGFALVAWYNLIRSPGALKQAEPYSGAPARALGYMAEDAQPIRNGQLVRDFVLLPDAGDTPGSDHRFGDKMIEVHLNAGDAVHFSRGSLVWVWGEWRARPGNPNREKPLYALEDARVQPTGKAEIAKYFH